MCRTHDDAHEIVLAVEGCERQARPGGFVLSGDATLRRLGASGRLRKAEDVVATVTFDAASASAVRTLWEDVVGGDTPEGALWPVPAPPTLRKPVGWALAGVVLILLAWLATASLRDGFTAWGVTAVIPGSTSERVLRTDAGRQIVERSYHEERVIEGQIDCTPWRSLPIVGNRPWHPACARAREAAGKASDPFAGSPGRTTAFLFALWGGGAACLVVAARGVVRVTSP